MWVANSFVNWNIATTYFNCGFSVPVRALLLLGARGQTMLTSNWGFEWRKNDVPPTSSHRSTFVYCLSWYTTNCRDQLPAQTRTFPRSSSIVHHKFWLNRKATARVFVDHLSDINPFFQRGLLPTDHLVRSTSSYLSSLIAFSLNNLVHLGICNRQELFWLPP